MWLYKQKKNKYDIRLLQVIYIVLLDLYHLGGMHLQIFITVLSVIIDITICIIITVSSTQTEVCGYKVMFLAWTPLGCFLGFTLTSEQLYNVLWCRWNIHSGRQHITMVILLIAMCQWFQQMLVHLCGLGPNPSLYMHISICSRYLAVGGSLVLCAPLISKMADGIDIAMFLQSLL